MKHHTFENAAVRLAGTAAVREIFAPIFVDRERELLVVAFCDEDLRLIKLLSVPGEKAYAHLPMVEIVRKAVCTRCAGFLVAHNHPSGDTRPSDTDLRVTRRLARAAEALDVTLLDHLIFDGGPAFSFRERGYL